MENIKSKKIILFFLLISTSIFVLQRVFFSSWDFEVYVLNGKYWFSNGYYFEVFRPPLVSLILGILHFLFGKSGEIIYLFLVSFLFMVSSVKLARTLDLNEIIFYGLSLNLFVLWYGMFGGTELLSLALMELFIYYFLIQRPLEAGILLGLSSLARYNLVIFALLLLCQKKTKKVFLSLLGFTIVWVPWLLYNRTHFGNLFYSFIDQYINNYVFRELIINYHKIFIDFLIFFNVLLLLIPILIKQKSEIFNYFKERTLIFLIMIFIILTTLLSYWRIPYKEPRYLFNLLIPVITFFTISLTYSKNGVKISLIFFIISWILLMSLVSFSPYFKLENDEKIYGEPIEFLKKNFTNCSLLSNNWVYLDYMGLKAGPIPFKEFFNDELNKGKVFVFYKFLNEPEYLKISPLSNYSILYNSSKVIIFMDNNRSCYSDKKYVNSYVGTITCVLEAKGKKSNICELLPNKLLTGFCKLGNVSFFN